MTLPQLIAYGILSFIGLYLIYIISANLVSLLWFLFKTIFYMALLTAIIWFLYKQGFLNFLIDKYF